MIRALFISLSLSLFIGCSAALDPVDFENTDGVYRTENVTSAQDCAVLCQQDKKCRGTVTVQEDTRKPEMVCRFYDGLAPGSPFEIKPPPPLSLTTALEDLNAYRKQAGLRPVQLDAGLIAASERHAKDLARHGIAAHEGTDGSTPAERTKSAGYTYSIVAENVATGQGSWEAVFEAWQKSPGHNKNLLRPDVTDFGVALVFDPASTYATYWTMLVAAPL